MNVRTYWKRRQAIKQAQINALLEDDIGDRYD